MSEAVSEAVSEKPASAGDRLLEPGKWVLLGKIILVVVFMDLTTKVVAISTLNVWERIEMTDTIGIGLAINSERSVMSLELRGEFKTPLSGIVGGLLGLLLILISLKSGLVSVRSRFRRKAAVYLSIVGLTVTVGMITAAAFAEVEVSPVIGFIGDWLGSLTLIGFVFVITRNRFLVVALAMAMGGGTGNFLCAVFYVDGVVDFIVVGDWIANVADGFIYLGQGMIVFWILSVAVLWTVDRFAKGRFETVTRAKKKILSAY